VKNNFEIGIGLELAKELEKAIDNLSYRKEFFPELVFFGMYISTLLSAPQRKESESNHAFYMNLHANFNEKFQGEEFSTVLRLTESAYEDYSNVVDSYLMFDITKSIYKNLAEIIVLRINRNLEVDISSIKQAIEFRIEIAIQIAREAYADYRRSNNIKISSAFKNNELSRIFENGDITATEFVRNIDYAPDLKNEMPGKSKLAIMALIFSIGLASGFIICKTFPSYSSAEECAIETALLHKSGLASVR